MARFDPAPHDKYAEDTSKPSPGADEDLENGLKDSFPASDPVSPAQPAPAEDGRRRDADDAKPHGR